MARKRKMFKRQQLHRYYDSEASRLAEHMISREFGDSGTWGGNVTEAIYLIGSLSPEQKELFIGKFIPMFETELRKLLQTDKLAMSNKAALKGFEEFAKFNPSFGGSFRLDEKLD